MPHEYLNPPGLFHHPNYTRVLTVEKPSKLIYIAGQTPADDNYQPLHPGDLRAQYAAVLDGLTLQLKAAGATWDDVVFRRMYALDVPAFLKVLNDRTLPLPWDVNRPSPSTLIGVTALANPGFLIEVEIMAVWRRDCAGELEIAAVGQQRHRAPRVGRAAFAPDQHVGGRWNRGAGVAGEALFEQRALRRRAGFGAWIARSGHALRSRGLPVPAGDWARFLRRPVWAGNRIGASFAGAACRLPGGGPSN